MDVILIVLSVVCFYSFFKIYTLHKSFDEICINFGAYQTRNDRNILRLEEKLLLQIKNIRISNEIDCNETLKKEIKKLKELYDTIDNDGILETIDDISEYFEDLSQFDVKYRVNELEDKFKRNMDLEDIESNIQDLDSRVDELNTNVAKCLNEDDVLEMLQEYDGRINQFDNFIKTLKESLTKEDIWNE